LLPKLKIIWLSTLSTLSVPDEGYSRNIPDEGYSRSVPDEDYSRNVPDEGYSRNVSCALNLISTFLLPINYIVESCMEYAHLTMCRIRSHTIHW